MSQNNVLYSFGHNLKTKTIKICWIIRFIQPVKRKPKRQLDEYDKSPIFDAIVSAESNVCSHKNGCDAFLLKVTKFQYDFPLYTP